jgi:hypothetical protein
MGAPTFHKRVQPLILKTEVQSSLKRDGPVAALTACRRDKRNREIEEARKAR